MNSHLLDFQSIILTILEFNCFNLIFLIIYWIKIIDFQLIITFNFQITIIVFLIINYEFTLNLQFHPSFFIFIYYI